MHDIMSKEKPIVIGDIEADDDEKGVLVEEEKDCLGGLLGGGVVPDEVGDEADHLGGDGRPGLGGVEGDLS